MTEGELTASVLPPSSSEQNQQTVGPKLDQKEITRLASESRTRSQDSSDAARERNGPISNSSTRTLYEPHALCSRCRTWPMGHRRLTPIPWEVSQMWAIASLKRSSMLSSISHTDHVCHPSKESEGMVEHTAYIACRIP